MLINPSRDVRLTAFLITPFVARLPYRREPFAIRKPLPRSLQRSRRVGRRVVSLVVEKPRLWISYYSRPAFLSIPYPLRRQKRCCGPQYGSLKNRRQNGYSDIRGPATQRDPTTSGPLFHDRTGFAGPLDRRRFPRPGRRDLHQPRSGAAICRRTDRATPRRGLILFDAAGSLDKPVTGPISHEAISLARGSWSRRRLLGAIPFSRFIVAVIWLLFENPAVLAMEPRDESVVATSRSTRSSRRAMT